MPPSHPDRRQARLAGEQPQQAHPAGRARLPAAGDHPGLVRRPALGVAGARRPGPRPSTVGDERRGECHHATAVDAVRAGPGHALRQHPRLRRSRPDAGRGRGPGLDRYRPGVAGRQPRPCQPGGELAADAVADPRWKPGVDRRPGDGRDGDRTLGALSATWDATRDGRTALRLRAGSTLVPGLVAIDCPDCPRVTRLREAAAGLEREFVAGSAAGVELLARRARLHGRTPAEDRETLVALHLNHHRRAYKLTALYQGWLAPARSELLALAGLGLTSWLSTGAVALYAPRATWAPLFEETRAGPIAPAPGASAWLLGVQLHAELGAFLGIPLGAVAGRAQPHRRPRRGGHPGRVPVPAPPRQLRLGMRGIGDDSGSGMNSCSSPGTCGKRPVLPVALGLLDALARAGDEVPPDVALAVERGAAEQHHPRRARRLQRRRARRLEHRPSAGAEALDRRSATRPSAT